MTFFDQDFAAEKGVIRPGTGAVRSPTWVRPADDGTKYSGICFKSHVRLPTASEKSRTKAGHTDD